MISLVANGHYHQGWPQIRKFYVYAMLFLIVAAPSAPPRNCDGSPWAAPAPRRSRRPGR